MAAKGSTRVTGEVLLDTTVAFAHGLPVATRDNHFGRVPGLNVLANM